MAKSALMVMDVQNGIVERFAAADALAPLQSAVQIRASRNWVPVIFVRVALRPGYVDVSPNNLSFSSLRARGGMLETDVATQIWDGVRPEGEEVVVVKRRVSAFAGSDLDVILRAVNELLSSPASRPAAWSSRLLRRPPTGTTSCLSLDDACADSDPEVHRVLLEKLFPARPRYDRRRLAEFALK